MKLTRTMTMIFMIALMAVMSLSTSFNARANGSDSDWIREALSDQVTGHWLAAQQQTPTINCGETKQGAIEAGDQAFQNGVRYDLYTFTTQQPNQPFIITAQAEAFPVDVAIFFNDPQQQRFVFQQDHLTAVRNTQIQFSGVFATPGQYAVVISGDSPQALGGYTVKLDCKACGATTPPPAGGADCSTGGTTQNPVAISIGQTLNCQLTANDAQLTAGGQTFYGKFFALQTQGGNVTLNAQSTAFTASLLFIDPPGNQPGIYVLNNNPATLQLPAGRYVIGVTSKIPNEPQKTGAFTLQVSGN